MKFAQVLAAFFILVGAACGPTESLPPTHDAGPATVDAGATCDGRCAPGVPGGWYGPALIWIGAEDDAPPCPNVAAIEGFGGHGYPDEELHCGACTCAPPIGLCSLPTTLTAAAASCAADGSSVPHTSFDPPPSWEGTCTAANAIPAGQLCDGVPCVQSVTIAPLTLTPGGCLPIEPPSSPPPTGIRFVRTCSHPPRQGGCGVSDECAPATSEPGFKTCIGQRSWLELHPPECPASYPDRNVFYEGSAPYCSPCACGIPTGGTCNGSITLFKDSACGTPVVPKVSIDSKGPTCTDVPPGSALGGKTASTPSFQGGYCTPSGGALFATVFCCLPQ